MALKNSRAAYGTIAKWLHWGVAALVLGSYVSMYAHKWFTAEGSYWHAQLIHWHFALGISIAALMVLRLVWRWCNPRPTLRALSRVQRRAARISHALLYGLLLFMPLSGYVSTGADTPFFGLFVIPAFEHTPAFTALGFEPDMLEPLKTLHHLFGAWVVWLLIGLHAGAGLYHHLHRRDDVLRRMTTRSA